MKHLYHFEWDCGRNGTVEGTFVAEESSVVAAMGKRVYFGEILGKHSEVLGDLGSGDIKILTSDPVFVEGFERYLPRGAGYNPLNYLSEEGET